MASNYANSYLVLISFRSRSGADHFLGLLGCQQVLNPTPATCHKQNGSCAAVFGMLRCRNCTATSAFLHCRSHFDQKLRCSKRKLHCNIEKAALQESGAFLPLSCGFQAPTFRHPRLGPAEVARSVLSRFARVHLVFDAFQTKKWRTSVFALLSHKMPLLVCGFRDQHYPKNLLRQKKALKIFYIFSEASLFFEVILYHRK